MAGAGRFLGLVSGSDDQVSSYFRFMSVAKYTLSI